MFERELIYWGVVGGVGHRWAIIGELPRFNHVRNDGVSIDWSFWGGLSRLGA